MKQRKECDTAKEREEKMNVDSKPYYQGNSELKKKGVNIQYTPEQVSEIVKCYQDIRYFLSNYVYIISLDKGKVLFDTYDFQKTMLELFSKHRFVICNLRKTAW